MDEFEDQKPIIEDLRGSHMESFSYSLFSYSGSSDTSLIEDKVDDE